MTVQIIISGDDAATTLADLKALTANLLGEVQPPANAPAPVAEAPAEKEVKAAKSAAKVEAAEPDVSEQDTAIAAEVEQQKSAKSKKGATTSKKASGPSEETLREYIATAAAYFLNDEDEAPKLAKILEDFMADDLEGIAAEDLANFSKTIFATGDDIFEGFPAVPKK